MDLEAYYHEVVFVWDYTFIVFVRETNGQNQGLKLRGRGVSNMHHRSSLHFLRRIGFTTAQKYANYYNQPRK